MRQQWLAATEGRWHWEAVVSQTPLEEYRGTKLKVLLCCRLLTAPSTPFPAWIAFLLSENISCQSTLTHYIFQKNYRSFKSNENNTFLFFLMFSCVLQLSWDWL